MSFEWPKYPYRHRKSIDPEVEHLQFSLRELWGGCQAADKKAIEAYLGCSIEEAKELCDNAKSKDEWNKGFDKWVGEKGG